MKRPITEQYIYSLNAANRIFKGEVTNLQIFHNCILVTFKKGQKLRPRFVSKSVFKEHFARWRQTQGRGIIATYNPLGGSFYCTKSSNIQEQYKIDLYPEHLTCTCMDYDAQEQLGIKRPCCKHIYAVLHYIGCDNLKDYIHRDGFNFLNTNEPLHKWDDPMKDYHDEMMAQETYYI